mgnify:CR=1 FL=1
MAPPEVIAASRARPQHPVHPVAMDEGPRPPAPAGDAVGEHREDLLELTCGEVAVWVGAAHEGEQVALRDLARGNLGDHLLRQHVERAPGHDHAVELSRPHGADGGGGLHELVPGERNDDALRGAGEPVARAADPLQQRGQRPGGPEVHDEIHMPDIDAELERGGGDDHRQLPGLQAALGLQPRLAGQAAVAGSDLVRSQPRGEMMGDALGQAPRVDEDQRGAVRADVAGDAVVDLLPQLVRGEVRQRLGGHLDGQRPVPAVADVDDGAIGLPVGPDPLRADQQAGDFFNGPLRRESPIRCSRRPARASRRSSDRARWLPRLSPATAWISSTMTARAVRRDCRLRSAVSRI